jgi:hypothetical protein
MGKGIREKEIVKKGWISMENEIDVATTPFSSHDPLPSPLSHFPSPFLL